MLCVQAGSAALCGMELEILLCCLIQGPVVLLQHQTVVRTFAFWNTVLKLLKFTVLLTQTVSQSIRRPYKFSCSLPLDCGSFSPFFAVKRGRERRSVRHSGVLQCVECVWLM